MKSWTCILTAVVILSLVAGCRGSKATPIPSPPPASITTNAPTPAQESVTSASTPTATPTAVPTATSTPFTTLAAFQDDLNTAVNNGDVVSFWEKIVAARQMPLIFDQTAVFLYRGEANTVGWESAFAGFNERAVRYDIKEGTRIGDTGLWMLIQELPADARFNYKIVLNGNESILDPLNPYQQLEGAGYESVIRMPEYEFPQTVIAREDIVHGTLSDDSTVFSENLGYNVNYRVYTPADYDDLDGLPVIYATDGQDFAHDVMGSMVIVLDNLIADGAIEPLIAVFIDPRDPDTGENRRLEELGGNDHFARFVTAELVPKIDRNYNTNASPEARAILGMSWGGVTSAYIGLHHSNTIQRVAILSPYLAPRPWIVDDYKKIERLPLKVFMSQGTYDFDMENTRALRDVLEAKGYPLRYVEVNDGHAWGNWRGLLDDMLIYLFGTSDS
jgi:enterochelin esterase-like enzyme